MAIFNATTGTDTPIQTTGNDSVVITNTDQIQALDVFDGNLGTDTILISGLTGVSVDATAAGAGAFKFYEAVAFDNTSGVSSLALNASIFGASVGQLPTNLAVTGVATSVQQVSILNANVFSAASWTFTNWGVEDSLSIGGTVGNDTLTGSLMNDFIVGNGGTDTMIGGAGNDTYTVDDALDVVTEDVGAGTDTVLSSSTYTLGANVENLTLTGALAVNGTGNELNNIMIGNSANNVLKGGLGNDTYYVQSGDVADENTGGGGLDTVYAAAGFTLGNNIENLVLQSTTGAAGNGNGLNNSIIGGIGSDTLDGKAGGDAMTGGLGDDKYYVDSTADVVTELVGEGTDTVNSAITYILGATLENLTLTGNNNVNATGNNLANILIGNSGANTMTGGALSDTLDGKAGADLMKGGTGNDIYWVDNASDVADETGGSGSDTVNSAVNYTLGTDVENLTLISSALTGTGNTLANTLVGNTGANTLTGLAGNDFLDGKSGVDTMIGGADNDTYVIDSSSDIITEVAGEGTDTAQIKVNYTLAAEVENMLMLGSSGVTGTGNELANTMTGNIGSNILFGMGGNDIINGGAGVDDMHGGAGDDTFHVDNVADEAFELAGEGTDTVISTKTFVLGAEIENLTLSGPQIINGTGNALDNVITGNANKNILNGAAGADTLAGAAGDDTYVIDSTDTVVEAVGGGADTVKTTFTYTLSSTQEVENLTLVGSTDFNGTGNALANVLTGGNGANVLTGLAGADTLLGFGGMDTLAGGTGADILTGGGLDDVFLFSVLADSNSANGVDSITDFTTGDKINVSAIDANTALAGDQAFVADANGTFVAGEYAVVADVDGYVFVNFYNDAVAGIDMQIRVKAAAVSDADFVL